MPPGERREYAGNAPPTTLTSGIDNATVTIPIGDGTGWPTGAVGTFFVVVDKGLTTEEKIKCLSRTGDVLTAVAGGRGQDGTAAASHSAGATIEHVVTADDMNLMNQHLADPTLDHHTQYFNTTRHAAAGLHSVGMIDMATLTTTLIPPGVMWDFAGAAAPAGWLLCNGAAVSRTEYAALYAALGGPDSPWGQGDGTTTFNVPDARGRATVGAGTGTGLTARSRGNAHGSETFVLGVGNMPAHSHTVNSHSHGGVTATEGQEHTHTLNGHVHWVNASGSHSHKTTRDDHYPPLIAVGSAFGLSRYDIGIQGTSDVSHTQRTSDDGYHDHGNTGGPSNNTSSGRSATHNHGVTAEAPGTNAQGSGTAFTHIGPRLTVTKIIKT